jgi:hypothetical protein
MTVLLEFYRRGRLAGGFETGVQQALARMLTSPEFIFRVERDPGAAPGTVHRVSDVELASRLSFFLWSSIPDTALLDAASQGRLANPIVLGQQVRRMLAIRAPRCWSTTSRPSGSTCAISRAWRRSWRNFPISTTTCARR